MTQTSHNKTCILCNNDNIIIKQKIKVKDIVELYKKSFSVDFSNEFSGDKIVHFYSCDTCYLKFFDTKYAGSPEFYEKLQEHRGVYYTPDREEFSYAKNFIEKEHKVLEIGSGSGFFAEHLEAKAYTGLEFNDKAIEEAGKRGVNLIKSSIESFSKENLNSFDVVCSFHVLEHVTHPYNYIKSSIDALKPGGLLIISVPLDDSPLTSNSNHVLNMPPHHISRWSAGALNQLKDIFEIDIVDSKNHTVSNLKTKDYNRLHLSKKLNNIIYKSNPVLLDIKKTRNLEKVVNFLINRLKIYNKTKLPYIGENVTYVFRKRSI